MKVPTYDNLSATPEALPGAREESVASPEILGHGDDQLLALGGATVKAGNAASAVAYQMQERENADAIFQNEASLKAGYINYEADVRKNRLGQFAKGVTTDTATWWKDNISKTLDTMQNPEQKRIFAQRATALQLQSLDTVSQFEGQQLEVAHDQSWKANKVTTTNMAAATPTPEVIASSIGQIKKLNAYQAAYKGWDADTLNAVNTDDTTNLHKKVLQSLALQNPGAAKPYYEAHKGEIAGSQQAEIGEFAEKATAQHIGVQTAGQIWNNLGPTSDTDPVQIDKMEAQARDQLKDNDYALTATINNLRERAAAAEHSRTERQNGLENSVNSAILANVPLSQIRAMPSFLALPDTKQRELNDFIIARSDRQDAKAQGDLQRKGFGAYLQYSNPTVLDNMTEGQVLNLLPVLGDTLTNNLMEKKRALAGSDARLSDAKIDNDDFNVIADKAGLKPYDKTKSDDERASLGQLRYNVEQRLSAEQADRKAPLTRQEKNSIMQQEIDNQVLLHNYVFSDDKVSAMLLNKDNVQRAYVNVEGGNRVMLTDIPPATRTSITRQLRAQKQPVTEQAIAQIYADMNPKKYPKPGVAR